MFLQFTDYGSFDLEETTLNKHAEYTNDLEKRIETVSGER